MAVTSIVYTQKGEEFTVDKLDETSSLLPNDVGSGTGTTAANKADTTLQTEVESRVTATLTQPSADKLRAVATCSYTANRAVTEVGLFDATSGGNLIIRAVFDAINVSSGDSIEFTIDLEFT